ncbi:hypothetical protein GJ496_002156 [Pomphorhynchus laevis]|nr:hypothetical protein GJ496_002156 [Pomphorhynchus laevis]
MGSKVAKQKDPVLLTNEDVQLLLDNTLYDEDTIRQWHKSFLIDCPNGKLDKKKLNEAYQICYPSEKREKFVNHVFRTFDTDNSGYIDFVEFLVALSITSNGHTEDKLKLAFDIYDINKNGFVDKKEMSKILTAIYDLMGVEDRSGTNDPKKRVDLVMNSLDKNHDQKISREEFVQSCLVDEVIRDMLTPMFNPSENDPSSMAVSTNADKTNFGSSGEAANVH